ncbi:MAG: DUF402 domain-containing protein [Gemmatimonadota bacterium]
MSDSDMVRIHYLRLPDHEQVYEQRLVYDGDEVKITLAEEIDVPPKRVRGQLAMEPGSDVVWFTFPGSWHDIGRFYLTDHSFAGFYANILTPADFGTGSEWTTTDLFLDVWMSPEGQVTVLDEDQFLEAVQRGHMARDVAERALLEVERIRAAANEGTWPPGVVKEWDLERALKESFW